MTGQMFGRLVSKDQQVVKTRFPIPAEEETATSPSASPPVHSDAAGDSPRTHIGIR